MSETSSAPLRGGAELVQPSVIRLYNNLTQVYQIMRERQKDIDAAFDRVAAQIGFVVTTTLPVRVEVAEGGAVKWPLSTAMPFGVQSSKKNSPVFFRD